MIGSIFATRMVIFATLLLGETVVSSISYGDLDENVNADTLRITKIDGVAVADDGWQGRGEASNGGQIAM